MLSAGLLTYHVFAFLVPIVFLYFVPLSFLLLFFCVPSLCSSIQIQNGSSDSGLMLDLELKSQCFMRSPAAASLWIHTGICNSVKRQRHQHTYLHVDILKPAMFPSATTENTQQLALMGDSELNMRIDMRSGDFWMSCKSRGNICRELNIRAKLVCIQSSVHAQDSALH